MTCNHKKYVFIILLLLVFYHVCMIFNEIHAFILKIAVNSAKYIWSPMKNFFVCYIRVVVGIYITSICLYECMRPVTFNIQVNSWPGFFFLVQDSFFSLAPFYYYCSKKQFILSFSSILISI